AGLFRLAQILAVAGEQIIFRRPHIGGDPDSRLLAQIVAPVIERRLAGPDHGADGEKRIGSRKEIDDARMWAMPPGQHVSLPLRNGWPHPPFLALTIAPRARSAHVALALVVDKTRATQHGGA